MQSISGAKSWCEERKKLLIENFFGKIPEIVIETGKEINYIEPELFKSEIFEYYKVAKRINCEGLIIKFLGKNTNYEFGKRKWLKVNLHFFIIMKLFSWKVLNKIRMRL